MITTRQDILAYGKEALRTEAAIIQQLAESLDERFERVVEAILSTSGHLIVAGMGKSGIIGRKMSATFASTGTPSFFLHPGEAFHGDLGMVRPADTVFILSHSGETSEVLSIIPFFRDNGNLLIAMTGNLTSTLARHAHLNLHIPVDREACPLDLAPTSSTTAMLAMGDAVAVALMKARNFQPENFARFHPGGTLGRKLLVRVRDIMRVKDLPIVEEWTPVQTVIHTISLGRLGLAVVKKEGKLSGIITDGDIRRTMEAKEEHFFSLRAIDLMTPNPKTISPEAKLTEAAATMNRFKIGSLLVTEREELIGIIQVFDLKI